MKMAKPSERDIDAAGDLISLLMQIDRGDYPSLSEDADVPDWFDEDNFDHLRALYDALKATLDKGPGYPMRVIGGMCYVIMWAKNEIVDPDSDTIDLHPKIVAALKAAESAPTITPSQAEMDEVREQLLDEVADHLEALNDSCGDAAAYDQRDMNLYEEERMHAIQHCANVVRALKRAGDSKGTSDA